MATILIIDDSEIALKVMSDILHLEGHTALLAKDGDHGIQMWCRNRETINLVLIDHTLPDMSGSDVFKFFAENDPDIKAVILTAARISRESYSHKGKSPRFVIHKNFPMLQSGPNDILEAINNLLNT